MSIEVRALNTRDALADDSRALPMFSAIMRHEPDVAVFSEAYAAQAHDSNTLSNTIGRFEAEGYAVTHGLYHDSDKRADSHGLLVVSRLGGTGRMVSLGSRNCAYIEGLADPETQRRFDFVGVHLDDRLQATRNDQIRNILRRVINPVRATIMAGNFNSTHPGARYAGLLRASETFIQQLGTIEPAEYHALSGLAKLAKIPRRVGSMGRRAVGMVDGGTMRRLAYAGFRDADSAHRPTVSVGGLELQLDHIMVSREFNYTRAHKPAKVRQTDHLLTGATVAFYTPK